MKKCIINCASEQWYPKGQRRLLKSLVDNGFDGDVLHWTNEFPNEGYDKTNLYNLKASALEEAINRGYTHILWADCSMWAVRNPQPIFDLIDEQGIYVETNGFNCAQECSDKSLEYFKVTRDEAENMPMCSSGLIGMNIEHIDGSLFAHEWINSCKEGAWAGSRLKDGQSEDPRFLHHRQDQSAASLILNKMGVKMLPIGTYFIYNSGGTQTDKTIFLCQGM